MKTLIISTKLLVVMSLLTGFLYTSVITSFSQIFFKRSSEGTLIYKNGKAVGSELIGQQFLKDRYFWSRPSAIEYNPMPSGGSNLALSSKKLDENYRIIRARFLRANNLSANSSVTSEMLFTSASGVDPHCSPEAAYIQIKRIAQARNFDAGREKRLFELVSSFTENPQLGFMGRPRINIFLLNLALDNMK